MRIATENKKVTRKQFMQEAHLDNTWNRIHTFNGLHFGTVLWQTNPWKLVSTTDFDKISDRKNKTCIIKEFYSQQDLWEYLRDNVFN